MSKRKAKKKYQMDFSARGALKKQHKTGILLGVELPPKLCADQGVSSMSGASGSKKDMKKELSKLTGAMASDFNVSGVGKQLKD